MQWSNAHPAKVMFEQMDRLRRRRGKLMDLAGFGPVETPFHIVHAEPGVALRRYGDVSAHGPVLLIVPAPIKRPYIWDLSPEVSVVRRCLQYGLRVYMVEWAAADGTLQKLGLADYGHRLLKSCVEAIEVDSRERKTILAGHSLGGVLAAIFGCLHPERTRAVLLLEAPMHFGKDAGNFAPLVAAAPDIQIDEETFGTVPGSFLNAVSAAAAPHVFQWERYVDLLLSTGDPATYRTHMRVERWAHDEFSLPGKLFSDVVERLYRDDEFMKGVLNVAGRSIGPANLTVPLLNVIDPRSTVIPPQSILPFHEAAASPLKKLLHYTGDIGVCIQHVGVLVGASAHAVIWPAIFGWLDEIGEAH